MYLRRRMVGRALEKLPELSPTARKAKKADIEANDKYLYLIEVGVSWLSSWRRVSR
jgi:hypothetical protein